MTPDGALYLKNKLDTSFLKYINPKFYIQVFCLDKNDTTRKLEKKFTVYVDLEGQKLFLPPIRYRSVDQLTPMIQFAQDSEFFIKLGDFQVDQDLFPLDRYDLKIAAKNVTLDDEGNLFMSEDPLKSIFFTLRFSFLNSIY